MSSRPAGMTADMYAIAVREDRLDEPFPGRAIYAITGLAAEVLTSQTMAGFWSPVIEHPSEHPLWCVAWLQKRYYLCRADELRIEDAGRVGGDNLSARAHLIWMPDGSPLRDLAMIDIKLAERRPTTARTIH